MDHNKQTEHIRNEKNDLKVLTDEELDRIAGGQDAHGCPSGTYWNNKVSRCVPIQKSTTVVLSEPEKGIGPKQEIR